MNVKQWALITALFLGCEPSSEKIGEPCHRLSDCGADLKCEESICAHQVKSNKSENFDLAHANLPQGNRMREGETQAPKVQSSNIHADPERLIKANAPSERVSKKSALLIGEV